MWWLCSHGWRAWSCPQYIRFIYTCIYVTQATLQIAYYLFEQPYCIPSEVFGYPATVGYPGATLGLCGRFPLVKVCWMTTFPFGEVGRCVLWVQAIIICIWFGRRAPRTFGSPPWPGSSSSNLEYITRMIRKNGNSSSSTTIRPAETAATPRQQKQQQQPPAQPPPPPPPPKQQQQQQQQHQQQQQQQQPRPQQPQQPQQPKQPRSLQQPQQSQQPQPMPPRPLSRSHNSLISDKTLMLVLLWASIG